MQDGSSPFLLPCGNSRVNDKKVNEERSTRVCRGKEMYPSTRPLLDTRLSRLLQNYKSFLKKISPKRRQIRTFGGTHKFAGDFLDKVPENRARPLVSQQAQRNLRGLSQFAKVGAVTEGDGEGKSAEIESLPLQPQAGVLR